MARFTKKAVSVLNNPELRCVAVNVMGLSKLESWQIKPAALETWAYQNKDKLKEGDPAILDENFEDKFRPGILAYVKGLHLFLNGGAKELPTWNGETGVSTQTHEEAAETLSDEALVASEPEVEEEAVNPDAETPWGDGGTAEDPQEAKAPEPEAVVEEEPAEEPPKRKRGRPKGSKNKPKVEPIKAAPKKAGVKKLALKVPVGKTKALEPEAPKVDLDPIINHMVHLDEEITGIKNSVEAGTALFEARFEKINEKVEKFEAAMVLLFNSLFEGNYESLDDMLE